MKQIQLNSGVFLLVDDLPADARNINMNIYNTKILFDSETVDEQAAPFPVVKHLPKGQWEIIGKGNEITEEAWRGIVEIRRLVGGIHERYTDYKDSSHWFKNPTESGHSWIKSHGMKPETVIVLKLKNNA